MKRYAILAITLGLVIGATLRWATSPVSSVSSSETLEPWQ
jgi:hypothetical protein